MSKVYTYCTRPETAKEQYALAYQIARRDRPMVFVGDNHYTYLSKCQYYDLRADSVRNAYRSYRSRHDGISGYTANRYLMRLWAKNDRLFDDRSL